MPRTSRRFSCVEAVTGRKGEDVLQRFHSGQGQPVGPSLRKFPPRHGHSYPWARFILRAVHSEPPPAYFCPPPLLQSPEQAEAKRFSSVFELHARFPGTVDGGPRLGAEHDRHEHASQRSCFRLHRELGLFPPGNRTQNLFRTPSCNGCRLRSAIRHARESGTGF